MDKPTFMESAAVILQLLGFAERSVAPCVAFLVSAAEEQGILEPEEFRLDWPTNYRIVTQAFGINPQNYARFGLPGHEGIDMRAPHGSQITACADGRVYLVHDGTGGHNYGIHVRLDHGNGYKTIYAHLERALVHQGQEVARAEVIGLADNTGNSFGSHLHLTLKKTGATAAGETIYPNDIIDPTPYLERRE